ncbi:MAG: outer membrane beta-barrel protein [Saprospiraceae bacterium]
MQDKEIHIDKKFTDRAWKDMRSRLDDEMPTGKRRRRFAWWWWPIGLAVVATGLAYVWYASTPIPGPAPSDKPAALERVPADLSKTQQPVAEALPASPSNVPSEQAELSFPGTSQQQPPPSIAAQHASTAKALASKKPNLEMDAQMPGYQQKLLNAIQLSAETFPLAKSEEAGLAEQQPPLRMAEYLSNPALAMLDNPAHFEGKLLEKPIRHPSPVGLSAYAGGMAAPSSAANGLEAGLMAGLPIGHSRFSVEGGAGYALVQQPLYIVVSQGADPTTIPTNETADEVFVSIADAEKVSPLEASFNSVTRARESLQMHYANFPLQIRYKVSPRWGLYGGANFGILLASTPGFTGGGLLNGFGRKLSDEYDVSVAEASKNSTVTLSRYDLSATGGLFYQLSRRLSLHARYQAGLLDLIKSNKEKEYNRFFHLTLRYQLVGKN